MHSLHREFLSKRAQFKDGSLEAAVLDILIEKSLVNPPPSVLYGVAYDHLHKLYLGNKLQGPDFLLATGMLRILLPHTQTDSIHLTLNRTVQKEALFYVRVQEIDAQNKKKGTEYTWPVGQANRSVIVDITAETIEITMK
jgi:hypothetical protein